MSAREDRLRELLRRARPAVEALARYIHPEPLLDRREMRTLLDDIDTANEAPTRREADNR